MSSCLLAAYASLRDHDSGTANLHIEKGFQYSLARWWQVGWFGLGGGLSDVGLTFGGTTE